MEILVVMLGGVFGSSSSGSVGREPEAHNRVELASSLAQAVVRALLTT